MISLFVFTLIAVAQAKTCHSIFDPLAVALETRGVEYDYRDNQYFIKPSLATKLGQLSIEARSTFGDRLVILENPTHSDGPFGSKVVVYWGEMFVRMADHASIEDLMQMLLDDLKAQSRHGS